MPVNGHKYENEDTLSNERRTKIVGSFAYRETNVLT